MSAPAWPDGWYSVGPDQWENAYGCSLSIEYDSTDGEAWASIGLVVTIGRSGEDGEVAQVAAAQLAQAVEIILSGRSIR